MFLWDEGTMHRYQRRVRDRCYTSSHSITGFRVWCVSDFFLAHHSGEPQKNPLSSGKRLKIEDRQILERLPYWGQTGRGSWGEKTACRQRRGWGRNGLHDLTVPQMMSPTTTAAVASTIIRMHIFFLELRWDGGEQHRHKINVLTKWHNISCIFFFF